MMNILEPESAWRSASASWNAITAGSGLNQSPDADPRSASQSQSETERRSGPHILVVEDNRADVFLIRESIQTAGLEAEIHVVHDGEKAIRFFEQADKDPSAPVPDLVILDINLPKKQGREVLDVMRRTCRSANAAVLVVTSSDSDRDREEMGALRVNAYFRKPSDYESFLELGELVKGLLTSGQPGAD